MPFRKELDALADAFRENGMICKWNEPLSAHTSFHIGGRAALCVWPTGQNQLVRVLSLWRELGHGCPLCVLGNGSNVLVSDDGFCGLVVLTTRARRVVFEEDNAPDPLEFRATHLYCRVFAECGASLTGLAKTCSQPERELSGLEFAYGIPGTVGGAVVMNAGAYGSDMERILLSAEYYDLDTGETARLTDEEMELEYRHSIFLDHPRWVVLSAVMTLSYGNGEDIRAKIEANMTARRDKQPLEFPSAGSVFKRPVDNFAGRMVEAVGMKGAMEGFAQVSEKHAGFIVHRNDLGTATAADVRRLVERVQDAVEEIYHYRLECEIRYISDGLDRRPKPIGDAAQPITKASAEPGEEPSPID